MKELEDNLLYRLTSTKVTKLIIFEMGEILPYAELI